MLDKAQRKKITSLRQCKLLIGKHELGISKYRCMNTKIRITVFCDVMPCNLIDNILETTSAFIFMVENANGNGKT
jgi:hypothetical protein